MKKPLVVLLCLLILSPWATLVHAGTNEPANTITENLGTLPTMQRHLGTGNPPATGPHGEDAARYKESTPFEFVYSGGLHATSGTAVSAAFETTAYTTEGNRVSQASSAIDYSAIGCNTANPGSDTAYVLISASTLSNFNNFVKVSGTNYYVNCTDANPSLPSDSAWLMTVTITNGALATVVDRRNRVISTIISESASYTTATDVIWRFRYGGMICPANGVTVTYNGKANNTWDTFQIFCEDGSDTTYGSVILGENASVDLIYSEWWGAVGDGLGDSLPALNAASVSTTSSRGMMKLLRGQYRTEGKFTYGDNFRLDGAGADRSIILCTTGVCVGALDGTQTYQYNSMSNFGIQCEDTVAPYDCDTGLQHQGRYARYEFLFINRMETYGFLIDPQDADGNVGSYYNHMFGIVVRGVTEKCVATIRGDDDDRPNGQLWVGGHWQNCKWGFYGEDGGQQRFLGVAIEGVTEGFMYINASGFSIQAPRMEVASPLGENKGITFGADGGGVTIEGGTITGGVVVTSTLEDPNLYCIKKVKINGSLITECPVDEITGPLLQVGNPWGCIGPTQNYAVRSEALDTTWTASGTAGVSANSITSPIGVVNADRITFGSTAGTTPARQQTTTLLASGADVIFGSWLKADTGKHGAIRWRIEAEGPGTEPDEIGQWSLHPEWQFYWAYKDFCTAGAGGCLINVADTVKVAFQRVVDDGMLEIIDVWGVMVQNSRYPKCYITTTSAAVAEQNLSVFRTIVDGSTSGVVGFVKSSTGVITDSDISAPATNGNMGLNTSDCQPHMRSGSTTFRKWHFDTAETVASANTISINACTTLLDLTGTTNINTINTCSSTFDGKPLRIRFTTSITVVDGSNLALNGNFVADTGDSLSLRCHGATSAWREEGRSAN